MISHSLADNLTISQTPTTNLARDIFYTHCHTPVQRLVLSSTPTGHINITVLINWSSWGSVRVRQRRRIFLVNHQSETEVCWWTKNISHVLANLSVFVSFPLTAAHDNGALCVGGSGNNLAAFRHAERKINSALAAHVCKELPCVRGWRLCRWKLQLCCFIANKVDQRSCVTPISNEPKPLHWSRCLLLTSSTPISWQCVIWQICSSQSIYHLQRPWRTTNLAVKLNKSQSINKCS